MSMFDLKDFFSKMLNQKQAVKNASDEAYDRIICRICNRICYNKKDLKIHMKNEHPDLTSAQNRA